MKMFLKKTGVMHVGIAGSLACFALLLGGCSPQPEMVQKLDTAMGTVVSQTLYVEGLATKEQQELSQEIISCINKLEQEKLSWRLADSEIYRINQSAGTESGILISDELAGQLEVCLKVSEASEGAFDVSIGEVVRLWDIDSWAGKEETSGFTIPSEAVIEAALARTGYEKISLQDNAIVLPKNLQLDLGAVGKGIALDEIRLLLKQHKEITGAVISVGGSILIYGTKPQGGSWNVGIVNPGNTSENIGVLKLTGEWCVSTSGDYERYVEKDGVRYHHILDPATGQPADSGVCSVTILTRDGLYSDALSTACFILGEEKGLALAELLEAEALFVLADGSLSMTKGMEQFFYLSNAGK